MRVLRGLWSERNVGYLSAALDSGTVKGSVDVRVRIALCSWDPQVLEVLAKDSNSTVSSVASMRLKVKLLASRLDLDPSAMGVLV